jgi:uncharacterized cupin superfamily protein
LDGPITRGTQFFGDLDIGPWVMINAIQPGYISQTHSHDQDEVFYIIQGDLTIEGQVYGPNTLMFMEKGTVYSFTAGSDGVRFLRFSAVGVLRGSLTS